MIAPCFKCKDRTAGCHGSCERYSEYHQKQIELSRARYAEGSAHSIAGTWKFGVNKKLRGMGK